MVKLDQPDFFQANCQTANQAMEVKTLLTALQITQENNQAFY